MHMGLQKRMQRFTSLIPKNRKKEKERERENGDFKNAKKDLRLLRKKGHKWERKQAFPRATVKIAENRRG